MTPALLRKKHLWILLILPLFVFARSPGASPSGKPDGDGFQAFYKDFQAAVNQNDAEKIAGLSAFPKFRWEPLTDQDLKTKSDFLKLFPKMFTPEVKKQVALGKFYKTAEGHYFIDWMARHLQYTLVFDLQAEGGYRFAGLLRGPE
jgi:hypothetical protein